MSTTHVHILVSDKISHIKAATLCFDIHRPPCNDTDTLAANTTYKNVRMGTEGGLEGHILLFG